GVVAGTYVVHYPAHLAVVPLEIAGLDPTFLKDAGVPEPPSARTPAGQSPSGRRTGDYLAYSYQDSRFAGTMRLTVEPARIASTVSTTARLDPDALRAHVEALVDIQGGGVRQLAVSLPEAAGTDLQFRVHPTSARFT